MNWVICISSSFAVYTWIFIDNFYFYRYEFKYFFPCGGLLPVKREESCRNKTSLCASFTRADLFSKEFQGSQES